MRWIIILLLYTQVAVAQVPNWIMPSPLGIVIQVGQWIYSMGEPVYDITVKADTRDHAFRLAIEQAIGTVVASETTVNRRTETVDFVQIAPGQVDQGQLRIEERYQYKDSLISYASGYVQKFEILEQTDNSITMRVWVRRSVISDRLLAESKTGKFADTAQTAARVTTRIAQREQGDLLLQQVLQDFPKRAFVTQINNTELTLDDRRQTFLTTKFTVEWDKRYLDSLMAVVRAGESDRIQRSMILTRMIDSRPQVYLRVISAKGHTIKHGCYAYSELDQQQVERPPGPYFVSYTSEQISYNKARIKGNLEFRIPIAFASDVDQVLIDIIPYNQCP